MEYRCRFLFVALLEIVSVAHTKFDAQLNLTDAPTREVLSKLLQAFEAWVLQLMKTGQVMQQSLKTLAIPPLTQVESKCNNNCENIL